MHVRLVEKSQKRKNTNVPYVKRPFIANQSYNTMRNKFMKNERLSENTSAVPAGHSFTIWLHSKHTRKQLTANHLQPQNDHA